MLWCKLDKYEMLRHFVTKWTDQVVTKLNYLARLHNYQSWLENNIIIICSSKFWSRHFTLIVLFKHWVQNLIDQHDQFPKCQIKITTNLHQQCTTKTWIMSNTIRQWNMSSELKHCNTIALTSVKVLTDVYRLLAQLKVVQNDQICKKETCGQNWRITSNIIHVCEDVRMRSLCSCGTW